MANVPRKTAGKQPASSSTDIKTLQRDVHFNSRAHVFWTSNVSTSDWICSWWRTGSEVARYMSLLNLGAKVLWIIIHTHNTHTPMHTHNIHKWDDDDGAQQAFFTGLLPKKKQEKKMFFKHSSRFMDLNENNANTHKQIIRKHRAFLVSYMRAVAHTHRCSQNEMRAKAKVSPPPPTTKKRRGRS